MHSMYSLQCKVHFIPRTGSPSLPARSQCFPSRPVPSYRYSYSPQLQLQPSCTAQLDGPCREAWSVVCGGKSAVSAAAAVARMREGDSSAARLAGVWLLLLQGLVMVRANTQVTALDT